MNKEEFVNIIKLVVINDSIQSVQSNLQKPAGRQRQKKLVELSDWFNNLKPEDKTMTLRLITESVETSVFSFLCVLDGVAAIEDSPEKGSIILNYEKKGISTWLNNPDEDYLHDFL